MKIYLDTSHLQKWQQETLSKEDISILNTLRDSRKSTFVLSIVHIFDISDREDNINAINIAKFLDQLPRKWLRNPVDLKREEIKDAVKRFKNDNIHHINIKPFVNDYVDTLESEPSTALIIPLMRRGSSIETIMTDLVSNPIENRQGSLTIEHLRQWASNNSIAIGEMPNNQYKEKEI
jgi:hypothetical protein